MPYIPMKGEEESLCLPVWRTFAKSIAALGTSADSPPEEGDDAQRLGVSIVKRPTDVIVTTKIIHPSSLLGQTVPMTERTDK